MISKHHKLIGITESILKQLEQPVPDLHNELGRSDTLEGFVKDLKADLDLIRATALSLYPDLQQSRLARLSTQLAVHFFTERSMHGFCEKVLDELIKETGARTGAFILFDRISSEVDIVASRNSKEEDLPAEKIRVSRTILGQIRDGASSILIEDALSDETLGTEDSVRGLTLRSVMAIPLRMEDYLAGAIHLENELTRGAFDEPDLQLLLNVGRFVTVYLDSAFRINEEIEARQRIYSELKGRTRFDGIVGSSPKLLKVLETVEQVAPSDASIIIEGENGTGKELIARALHKGSKRSHRDLIVVNCAAIPDTLLESQLFGHERGSFTGAVSRQIGRLEQGNGSTVFLDEIGELSIGVQAKLLRFLQNREIERLGGTKTIQLDVRLVAATNRDIGDMVRRGDFREDLYYRLYVIPIKVPSLRERPEDIPLLADHFIDVFSLQSGRKRPVIDPDVYEALQKHKWPGNIRELENLIQRVVVLCKSDRITLGDLPPNIAQAKKVKLDIDKNPFGPYFANLPSNWSELKRRRKQMLHIASVYANNLEDKFIDELLERTGGNISRAATESGMHRTLIHRKLKARSQ